MSDVKKVFRGFNLQFFGDDGANGNGGSQQNDGAAGQDGGQESNGNDGGNSGAQNGNGNGDGSEEKKFTQSEVSKMMTREKQQGKQSVLNALGFKTEKDAKDALNLLKALQDSQKSEEEKVEEAKNTAIQEKAEAEKRAEMAEAKLACIVNGADKDSIDDVLTIALTRVTDDKDLEAVIGEMKKQAKYSSFFASKPDGNDGTGNTPGNSNEGGNSGSADYGKQVAEKYGSKLGASNGAKSKFF